MARVVRGLGSLAILLLGVVGIPVALALLGGNPLPDAVTVEFIVRALLTPDDGTVLIGLVTLVGWIAWLVFALSVLTEVVATLSRQRIRIRVPGLGGPQRLAAGLLISVIAMLSTPQVAPAPAPPPVVAVTPVAVSAVVPPTPVPMATVETPSPAAPSGRVPAGVTHVVRAGDDLWSLAQRYYDDGRAWRKIAAANPDRLTGGPDRLAPGWKLIIPEVDRPAAEADATRQVTVRRGDSLSLIADRELGSADRWRDLYRANRAQIEDPDELTVGMRLTVPEHDTAAKAKGHSETVAQGETADRPRHDEQTAERAPAEDHSTSTVPSIAPASPPPVTAAAPPPTHPVEDPTSAPVEVASDMNDLALPLAGVGVLLAAGLTAGLRWRRQVQLRARPQGRRILQPPPSTARIEMALGHRQRPLSLRTLDRATRAIAAHCRATGVAPPPLQLAFVGDDEIELVMREQCASAPVGFTVRGRSWLLARRDTDYLASVPGFADAARPWPALVSLGRDERDREVLADLEGFGLLQLVASPGSPAPVGILAAMALELSFSPWAEEMILTLVGPAGGLPEALGRHNVTQTDDLDGLLDRIERRAVVQRDHHPQAELGRHRIDPDLADPWAPEILLINTALTPEQQSRLAAVVTTKPPVTVAAVVIGDLPVATWRLRQDNQSAVLEPTGLRLSPQRLEPVEVEAVVQLVEATGSEETTAAPWWRAPEVVPDPPPDNVTYLGKRFGGWETTDSEGAAVIMQAAAIGNGSAVHHPLLQMMGPVELLGAAGIVPPRASKQCLEYCGWLLENPGTTAQAMGSALAVAEGTRRSNMSRLRSWLGPADDGSAYLPDAYTGYITLHPAVSSDWQRLQILTAAGVNRVSDESLYAALQLVRGAPLADAAPGQWHWAEELRTDMISCVRDIGVELAERALTSGDLDLARWAAARALAAAPADELLIAARIRTEHRAGNTAETERLALQLAGQARTLGVDLDPATVTLLQRVMEGRVRARMA